MAVAVAVDGVGRSEMGDVFWERVLGADGGDAAFGCFAGFGEGVVAGIEVFALLLGGEGKGMRYGNHGFVGMEGGMGVGFTFNLFWRRSFLLGSLP